MKSMNRRKSNGRGHAGDSLSSCRIYRRRCLLGMGSGDRLYAEESTAGSGTPFGTDWMGRDMLARTLKGLSLSILLGILAAGRQRVHCPDSGIASATLGKTVDKIITFMIDLILGIPHILLLLLISVALGKGLRGVAVGIVLTHWPSLARLIRAEVLHN